MEWKWSKGEREQSKRIKYPPKREFTEELETSAYANSLNHDENSWDMLNQMIYSNGFKLSSKREELDNKMSNRDMVQQIGFNPFLGQSSYVEDVSIRDQFLKPINTTMGMHKESNSTPLS
jgi:hypothetical protein